ncbi:MAG: hypothetical protein [Bacteriophage sp.]|nr:MAG: hypothetical protein [Bacteriophage sp.]
MRKNAIQRVRLRKKLHIKYGVKTLSGRNIPVGFLVSEKQYIGVRYILTNGVQ